LKLYFLTTFVIVSSVVSLSSCRNNTISEKSIIPDYPINHQAEAQLLADHPIEAVVHRGANHLAPENTYAAAARTIELGVDYVEIDVHRS